MADVRKSRLWSGVGILAIALVLIAVAAYVILNPEILENIIYVILIVCVVIVAILIVVALAMMLAAIPLYVKKGEVYQTNQDYSIDDVKSVKEKTEPTDGSSVSDGTDGMQVSTERK